jgi:hypothetical protein
MGTVGCALLIGAVCRIVPVQQAASLLRSCLNSGLVDLLSHSTGWQPVVLWPGDLAVNDHPRDTLAVKSGILFVWCQV